MILNKNTEQLNSQHHQPSAYRRVLAQWWDHLATDQEFTGSIPLSSVCYFGKKCLLNKPKITIYDMDAVSHVPRWCPWTTLWPQRSCPGLPHCWGLWVGNDMVFWAVCVLTLDWTRQGKWGVTGWDARVVECGETGGGNGVYWRETERDPWHLQYTHVSADFERKEAEKKMARGS